MDPTEVSDRRWNEPLNALLNFLRAAFRRSALSGGGGGVRACIATLADSNSKAPGGSRHCEEESS